MTLAVLAKPFGDAVRAGALQSRAKVLPRIANSLTNAVEASALVQLIDMLKPANVLEIGTYFAGTARILAEAAAAGGGTLVTIDPQGGQRVPPVIASWPEPVRGVTKFFPITSMAYFFSLHVAGQKFAAEAPFNVIYVDGNHAFAYATFDLFMSATYLRPGGAIVVDNIDTTGVRVAVETFLGRHTHWHLFRDEMSGKHEYESLGNSHSAILLAPNGIEVGQIPYRFIRPSATDVVNAFRIPVVPTGARGALEATANLFFVSHDNQKTGAGMVGARGRSVIRVDSDAEAITVNFEPPVKIAPPAVPGNRRLEIEFTFVPDAGSKNLLLDPACKVEVS